MRQHRWVPAWVLATGAGALAAQPVPLPAVGAVLAVAGAVVVCRQHPALLAVVLALAASELAHRAEDGLVPPPEGAVYAEVVLVSDPRPSGSALAADARLGRQLVMLRARGPAAEALADRLAGEHVLVAGELSHLEPAGWLRARHLAARVDVWRVQGWRQGSPVSRAANGFRLLIERGAASLPTSQRALFTGLVVGDDRAQSPEEADAFRATGLTHLTAVSGQNVALLLALCSPVLVRLRLWPRLGATLALIAGFGVVTRFEPSVLRASALAGVAAVSATVGRPVERIRALGLAVVGLLLVDPLLVHSPGFQLSVAATTGILLGAGRLAGLLPGPAPLRNALGLAAAAQLGVAPVLLATFGPVPLASLPANVAAVPVTGLVMAWGLTAGVVAGLAGGAVAEMLHLPTRALVGWIALVADRGAALPLGVLGPASVAAVGAGLVAAVGWRHRRPGLARVGVVVVLAVLGLVVLGANRPAPLRSTDQHGVVVWQGGGGVAVELAGAGAGPPARAPAVLAAVRAAGVRHVDVVVVTDGGVDPRAVDALRRRYRDPSVLGPVGLPGVFAARTIPAPGAALTVRGLRVDVAVAGSRLVVEARPARGSSGSSSNGR